MVDVEYTHQVPDNDLFFRKILKYLHYKGEEELYNMLRGGRCNIKTTTKLPYLTLVNIYHFTVIFEVLIDKLKTVNQDTKERLIKYCKLLMTNYSGFVIMDVEFVPFIPDDLGDSVIDDLERILDEIPFEVLGVILPENVIEKGKDMAKSYTLLYYVENSLRSFIEKIFIEKYGDDYINSINVNIGIRKNIEIRKREESINKWLRIRGDSDIYYLDLADLASIIRLNWGSFKDRFPSQEWITIKIAELTNCRHLVAHNSYIGEEERELIKVYFRNIIKQIR